MAQDSVESCAAEANASPLHGASPCGALFELIFADRWMPDDLRFSPSFGWHVSILKIGAPKYNDKCWWCWHQWWWTLTISQINPLMMTNNDKHKKYKCAMCWCPDDRNASGNASFRRWGPIRSWAFSLVPWPVGPGRWRGLKVMVLQVVAMRFDAEMQ